MNSKAVSNPARQENKGNKRGPKGPRGSKRANLPGILVSILALGFLISGIGGTEVKEWKLTDLYQMCDRSTDRVDFDNNCRQSEIKSEADFRELDTW